MCYWNVEHADNAIAEAEKVAAETGANAMPVSSDCRNLSVKEEKLTLLAWWSEPVRFTYGPDCRPIVIAC